MRTIHIVMPPAIPNAEKGRFGNAQQFPLTGRVHSGDWLSIG